MEHFAFLDEVEREQLFAVPPRQLAPDAQESPAAVGVALGATVYTPATRPRLDTDARRLAAVGATSTVWCLEDSVPHARVPDAERNVVAGLIRLAARPATRLPLVFVRVREPGQLARIVHAAGPAAALLAGVVLPKFSLADEPALAEVVALGEVLGTRLLAMPVLETPAVAWVEQRHDELVSLRALVDAYAAVVPAVRVGATDLCGLFGLRRDARTTVWDVAIVRDLLADVVNVFGRGREHVVAGPVWEHFAEEPEPAGPTLVPTARRWPVEAGRERCVGRPPETLAREIALDLVNGLTGKTVIHPRHVGLVNAMLSVDREQYDDALAVVASEGLGGAFASVAGNKMNESGPHSVWARSVLARAEAFGVLARPDGLARLVTAAATAHDRVYAPVGALSPAGGLVP